MLEELSIRNFAIIDDLQISFGPGLTILSGETGAGKSIIVNAVNLLLGGRASTRMIRTGCETAEVAAVFRISAQGAVAGQLAELGLMAAGQDQLLVRRIIARSNRHRVYINDRPATLQAMNRLTENLASIAGQHAYQGLLKPENHLLILDQFAGLLPARAEVARLYNEILPLVQRRRQLLTAKQRQAEQMELLSFQKDEILQADLRPGEDLELEQRRVRLKNIQNLFGTVHNCLDLLYSGQGSAMEQLVRVAKELASAGRTDPELEDFSKVVNEVVYRLEDLTSDLRTYQSGLETDQGQLDAVEDRLDLINRLKRKYGGSIANIIDHGRLAARELESIAGLDDQIGQVEQDLERIHENLCRACRQLAGARRKACADFIGRVEEELADLEMGGTRFEISLQDLEPEKDIPPYLGCGKAAVNETGTDRALFLIAPNQGEELKPLAEIASGGELSRVVLALKVILARTESVETLIFDEVDAGIGGQAAEMVGRKLARLAEHHQTLCITHLPQIAKFGSRHLYITKQVKDGRTRTVIKALAGKQRVEELARMIAGKKITPTTMAHAREMLENR